MPETTPFFTLKSPSDMLIFKSSGMPNSTIFGPLSLPAASSSSPVLLFALLVVFCREAFLELRS